MAIAQGGQLRLYVLRHGVRVHLYFDDPPAIMTWRDKCTIGMASSRDAQDRGSEVVVGEAGKDLRPIGAEQALEDLLRAVQRLELLAVDKE
jgi:hypothetical protein